MHLEDCRGVGVSAASQSEVDAFDAGFELFLNYENAAGSAMKQALADHPSSVLAIVLRGYMMMMVEVSALHPKVAAMATAAIDEHPHANDRERGHLQALHAWAAGDVFGAAALWDRLLAANPHDLLALKMHHYTTFWTGRASVLLSAVEGVIGAWDATDPGYDHVLGMYAFALNETGRYELAETMGRDAVERNSEDLWSIHSVAHALEMQGDLAGGDAFFDVDPAIWATKNPFIGHIWWHAALFPWNAGHYDRVLTIYDDRLRPASTDFFLDIQNLSSLLTRLELAGVDVGDRWDELGDHAAARTGDHVLSFTDVHCALTLGRTGRVDELEAFVASLGQHVAALTSQGDSAVSQDRTAGPSVALAVSSSLLAAARDDYPTASRSLGLARGNLTPIGGSHAQRDVFDQLLAAFTEAAGDLDMARHIVRARMQRWPNSVPTLNRYERLLELAAK